MNTQSVMSRLRRRLLGEQGVSLVEMLIGVSIGLVVMGGSYGIFLTVSKVWSVNSSSMDQQADARLAILRVSKEVRSASRVLEAKANYIQFHMPTTAYSDQAPSATGGVMTVAYALEAENDWYNLRRSVVISGTASSSIVSRYLRNNNNPGVTGDSSRDFLRYFSSTGDVLAGPVANPDLIESVLIQVMTDIDTTKKPNETLESTSVMIRTNAIQ